MEGESNPVLQLRQGVGQLVRMKVLPAPYRHKQKDEVRHAISAIDRVWHDGSVQSGAILRATRGKHVISLAHVNTTEEESAAPNRYTVEISDHRSDQGYTVIEQGSKLSHFVNIFQFAPEKREELIAHFEHTLPYMRKQPGYVSTSLLLSVDQPLAVNIGQFNTSRHFRASLCKREVLGSFAKGYPLGIMAKVLGVLPKPPQLHLCELAHVVGGSA